MKGIKCPVCEKTVFKGYGSSFDICPVCGWEDDRVQVDFPLEHCCANNMCLIEAREAYKAGRVDLIRMNKRFWSKEKIKTMGCR